MMCCTGKPPNFDLWIFGCSTERKRIIFEERGRNMMTIVVSSVSFAV